MYSPGKQSKVVLSELCDDMTGIVMRAYQILDGKGVDMSCIESRRSIDNQRRNIEAGVSWTMDSYHIREHPDGSGVLAVDIYPWIPKQGTSHDTDHYERIALAMFQAAQEAKKVIHWGGYWTHPDRPHWQLMLNR